MRTIIALLVLAFVLPAQEPLAGRIVRNDPRHYRSSMSTHGGAGELRYQTLLRRGVLRDLNFVHRGLLMPRSSIGHHFHNDSEEMFFILDGEAQFTVDGRTSVVEGPVGVPCGIRHSHALYNPSDKPLEWMNINVRTGPAAARGIRDPTGTFDLGDDRAGVPLDAKPVFITIRLRKSLPKPVEAMNGGTGTVQYRRSVGPSLFSSSWAYLDHLLLPPGTSLGRHMHAGVDEFYYVTAGEGTVQAGEESAAIRAGDGIPVPAGDVHSFRNEGSAPLELLVLGLAADKAVLDTTDVK